MTDKLDVTDISFLDIYVCVFACAYTHAKIYAYVLMIYIDMDYYSFFGTTRIAFNCLYTSQLP